RNPSALCCDRGKTAVRIAKYQHCVRLNLLKYVVALRNDVADRFRRGLASRFEEVIRITNFEVFEEYLAQFVIIVLARMYQDMVNLPVESRNHPGEPDD